MLLTIKKPLPGLRAQREMAPSGRAFSAPDDAQEAAVLVLLSPQKQAMAHELLAWQVLLIRRASYPGVHSGQIAFPGGKKEKADQSLWETACREASEEVGLVRADYYKVGGLSSLYIEPSNYVIKPYVAIRQRNVSYILNPQEVAEIKNVPLRVFNPEESVQLPFAGSDGRKRMAPAWEYEDFIVWGATAMILAELYYLAAAGALIPDNSSD